MKIIHFFLYDVVLHSTECPLVTTYHARSLMHRVSYDTGSTGKYIVLLQPRSWNVATYFSLLLLYDWSEKQIRWPIVRNEMVMNIYIHEGWLLNLNFWNVLFNSQRLYYHSHYQNSHNPIDTPKRRISDIQ